jgi:hypothetical protein
MQAARLVVGWCLMLLFMSAKDSGCRQSGSAETVKVATEPKTAAFLLDKLSRKQGDQIKTLSAKARITVGGEGEQMQANANIIWIRDSVVWINIKKFGFEALRALITRDSVFMLNRLEKTYSVQAIDAFQRQYNLPEGFTLLQQTMLANAWLFPGMNLQPGIKDELHDLKGSDGQYAVEYGVEEGSFLLKKETFIQQKDARMLTLQFDDYKKLPGTGLFPYLRRVQAYSPENGNMEFTLELSDIEINTPQTFRFEVPDYYKRQ